MYQVYRKKKCYALKISNLLISDAGISLSFKKTFPRGKSSGHLFESFLNISLIRKKEKGSFLYRPNIHNWSHKIGPDWAAPPQTSSVI